VVFKLLAVIFDGIGIRYLSNQQGTKILLKIFLECRGRGSNDALCFVELAKDSSSIRKRIDQLRECGLAEFASSKHIFQVFKEGSFISFILNFDL
jgi:hypothetical protein